MPQLIARRSMFASGFLFNSKLEERKNKMQFDVNILAVVIGFMILANRLVDMLITPLFEKYGLDKFWLKYVAWAVSGVLVAFSQVNLFVDYIPSVTVGLVLTAIVAGGGANLLHDLTDKPSPQG